MNLRQRILLGVLLVTLAACQSQRERLLAADYPPAFVDGFEAGCQSGRAAAGPLGGYTKAVNRYQAEPLYAQGWDDGFRQCEQAQQRDDWQVRREQDWRDREWRHHVDQAMAKALSR